MHREALVCCMLQMLAESSRCCGAKFTGDRQLALSCLYLDSHIDNGNEEFQTVETFVLLSCVSLTIYNFNKLLPNHALRIHNTFIHVQFTYIN